MTKELNEAIDALIMAVRWHEEDALINEGKEEKRALAAIQKARQALKDAIHDEQAAAFGRRD